MIKKHLSSVDQQLNSALAYQQGGDYLQAKKLYDEILQNQPNHPDALHFTGILYAQMGDFENALIYLQKASQQKPQASSIHNNLANVLKHLENIPEAILHYEKAIQLEPDSAQAYNNLANLYFRQGELDKTIRYYAIAVNLEPDHIEAHFNLGLVFLKQKNLNAAIKQFQNVLQLDPENSFAHKNLADIYLRQENLVKARDHYETVLRLYPDHLEALNNLGVVLLKQDKFEEAIRHYQILLQYAPENLEAHYNLGVALMSLGKLNQALVHFNKVIEVKPEHIDSLCNLGAIYLKLGEQEQALATYQQAKHYKPNDATINYMINTLTLTQDQIPPRAPTEYIQNLFDNYAVSYDKHVTEVLSYQVPHLIREQIDANKKNKDLTILDLGCGTGLIGEQLQDKAKRLVGVDLSEKMIAKAKARHSYQELICADIKSYLSSCSDKFDVIVAADVFVYLGDLKEILKLCKPLLKEDGLFIFSVEALTETSKDYILRRTARYAHKKKYIEDLAGDFNFKILLCKDIIPRIQDNKPLAGYLFVLA